MGKRLFPGNAGVDPVLTQEARQWLRQLDCTGAAKALQVVWNGRLQTTAGTACAYTMRVELNPRLQAFGEAQISRTLRHEIAHVVAHIRAGKRARRIQTHGPEWRQACTELGIAGEPAFHDLPFERRTLARKHTYECPHCGLVAHRVRKFERYTACYQCCKKYNHGQFSPQFQFRRIPSEVARLLRPGQTDEK